MRLGVHEKFIFQLTPRVPPWIGSPLTLCPYIMHHVHQRLGGVLCVYSRTWHSTYSLADAVWARLIPQSNCLNMFPCGAKGEEYGGQVVCFVCSFVLLLVCGCVCYVHQFSSHSTIRGLIRFRTLSPPSCCRRIIISLYIQTGAPWRQRARVPIAAFNLPPKNEFSRTNSRCFSRNVWCLCAV